MTQINTFWVTWVNIPAKAEQSGSEQLMTRNILLRLLHKSNSLRYRIAFHFIKFYKLATNKHMPVII